MAELGGGDVVIDDAERTEKYRLDRARDVDAGRPAAVVRAQSTEDVQAAVRYAALISAVRADSSSGRAFSAATRLAASAHDSSGSGSDPLPTRGKAPRRLTVVSDVAR